MKTKRNIMPTLVLGGCSLFGIGIAELAWNLLFPDPGTILVTAIVSCFMIFLGLTMVVLANRMETQEPEANRDDSSRANKTA